VAKEFAASLILSTPYMRGQKVKDAQWLLKGNGRFQGLSPFKDHEIDGVYGPVSAQATRRAKYWLGYPPQSIDGVFGQKLYEYLRPTRWRPLPKDYQTRRKQRLAEAANTPGKKALDLAHREVGYHESPAYSNRTKFGIEYGFNGVPWCAIFESVMFKHAGYPRFRYAAVQQIYSDAVYGRNNLRRVWTPAPGDVVCYSLHGNRYAHTAFFDGWHDPGASFWDLGGNTSARDFSNGGEVARQVRTVGLVLAFVRYG